MDGGREGLFTLACEWNQEVSMRHVCCSCQICSSPNLKTLHHGQCVQIHGHKPHPTLDRFRCTGVGTEVVFELKCLDMTVVDNLTSLITTLLRICVRVSDPLEHFTKK